MTAWGNKIEASRLGIWGLDLGTKGVFFTESLKDLRTNLLEHLGFSAKEDGE
jgi:hypothetical protein